MSNSTVDESTILRSKPRALRPLFFAYIRAHPGCTRTDLARAFGWYRGMPSEHFLRRRVAEIVTQLIRKGLVDQCDARPEVAKHGGSGLRVPGSAPGFDQWPEHFHHTSGVRLRMTPRAIASRELREKYPDPIERRREQQRRYHARQPIQLALVGTPERVRFLKSKTAEIARDIEAGEQVEKNRAHLANLTVALEGYEADVANEVPQYPRPQLSQAQLHQLCLDVLDLFRGQQKLAPVDIEGWLPNSRAAWQHLRRTGVLELVLEALPTILLRKRAP